MNRLSRRRFLSALSAGGALYAFGRTPGTVMAQTAALDGFSDYKSLVCVFLLGGNDSWSVVVPRSDAEYAAYAASRQNLAIARDALLPIEPLEPDGAAYGVHPSMPGVQSLFETGRCAVIANVGPLIEPVTLEQYQQGSVSLPPQLFSHNDQQDQWHTLRGRQTLIRLGGPHRRRARGTNGESATGPQHLTEWDHALPGRRICSAVRDGRYWHRILSIGQYIQDSR